MRDPMGESVVCRLPFCAQHFAESASIRQHVYISYSRQGDWGEARRMPAGDA